MANLFVISDTHFGDYDMLALGIRPAFRTTEEMDEAIVDRWNGLIKGSDHVYHLGDVAMKRKDIGIVSRLNGKKRLIFGNHDIFDYQHYAEAGFKKLMSYRVLDGLIFSHIPIHPRSIGRFKLNIHGHIHESLVKTDEGAIDHKYLNVCVEHVNYTPVALEDIKKNLGL